MSWEDERDENERLKAERGMLRQVSPLVGEGGKFRPVPPSARTESQLELWELAPESFDFVEKWLNLLPRARQREHFRKLHLTKFKEAEHRPLRTANVWLRELLGVRLKKVFSQYKVDVSWLLSFEKGVPDFPDFIAEMQFSTKTDRTFANELSPKQEKADIEWQSLTTKFNQHVHREMAKGSVPFYLLSSNKLAEIAYQLAMTFAKAQREFADEQLAKEKAFSTEEINELMLQIYATAGCAAEAIGFPLKNWETFQRRKKLKAETVDVTLMRICDERYWLKQMRHKQKQMIEHIAIACGEVRKHYSSYISKNALIDWNVQQKKNYDFLKSMIIENVDNPEEQQDLLDMVFKSDTNPVNRRHLMMTMLNGVEAWAEDQGDVPLFLTLTAPSRYHATLFNGLDNPKWNGASPNKTHKYLNSVWVKTRALLAKRGIRFYGMRVAEPHHDATPHWHLLMFVKPEQKEEVITLFRNKALEEDGNERGAKEHRFLVEEIDPEKGSATAYIAKYIAKNVDGFAKDDERSDEDPELLLKDNAKRARAWASLWHIRQFQFYGVPSVGVWRELRRLTAGDISDEELEEMRLVADVGCFASYIKRQGGTMTKRADQAVRLHYCQTEPNKFGETRQKIDGVRLSRCLDWVKTRLKQWILKRKVNVVAELDTREQSDPNMGGFSAPRTCVSNCNPEKVNDTVEFMRIHRNEVEILREFLLARQISSRWITDYRLCRLIKGEKVDIYAGMSLSWNGRELEMI
ncbi:replication protein [Pasteurellaceae bacterium Pebbles2]|nr:replication protein [Pasteurellaceae bacterium Pebbles2]